MVLTRIRVHRFGDLFWEPVDLPHGVQVWRLVHVCVFCSYREEV